MQPALISTSGLASGRYSTLSTETTAALVYVSAFGGHEFNWKEVTFLYVVLMIFSWAVFVKGLTLPFPVWPEFIGG